jgi:hypothetical protein
VELIMAFEVLQLSAAITASQVVNVPLVHVSGPVLMPALGQITNPNGVPVLIDSEFFYAVQQTAPGVYTIRGRGSEGTAALPHDVLANAYASLTNDWGNPQPGDVVTINPSTEDTAISLGQDGTVTLLGSNVVYNINKASAAALTVTPPLVSDNGVLVVFTSNTGFAHVITSSVAGGFKDGASAKTTITFAAVAGASVTLLCENGAFNVQAQQNVTLS